MKNEKVSRHMKSTIVCAFILTLVLTVFAIALFPVTQESTQSLQQLKNDDLAISKKDSTVLQKNEKYLSKHFHAQQIGILDTEIIIKRGKMSYKDGYVIKPDLSSTTDANGIVKGYQFMYDMNTHYILVDTIGGHPKDQWLPVPTTNKEIQVFKGELFRPETKLTVIRTKKSAK